MEEYIDLIAPYNLWYNNVVPTGFQRGFYTDRLIRSTGNRLIKILSGQRRVGKSYIMRQLAMELIRHGTPAENTIFINKELAVYSFIKTSDDLNALINSYFERFQPQGRIYIFIDEVQEIKDWERIVNSLSQDYTKEIEVFISGSNSRMLSGELATMLSGRYLSMQILPFSYREYIEVWKLHSGRESFLKYIKDGGLPELIHLPDNEIKERYIEGLKDSIMLKDIVKRYSIKDIGLLESLFAFLVNNSSNLISIGGIVKYMKGIGSNVSYDTVAAYINYLQEAYLIHRSVRYNIAGKENLGGNFKVYPNDQSYHNYLYPTARYGVGYALEGIIYLELVRKGYVVTTGVLRQSEIDFVATSKYRTLYVQVAYSIEDKETAEREYSAFQNIRDDGEKYLITLDDYTHPIRKGVRHLNAWDLSEI